MNEFVRLHSSRIDTSGAYEPAEPILIEVDFKHREEFIPSVYFKLGLVCKTAIIYNEPASDGCIYMRHISQRYRINGKVYDLTKYGSNKEALPAFIAMVEENIQSEISTDIENIIF